MSGFRKKSKTHYLMEEKIILWKYFNWIWKEYLDLSMLENYNPFEWNRIKKAIGSRFLAPWDCWVVLLGF